MIDFARAGLTALLAAFALPGAAQACTDSSADRHYFQREAPQMTPDIMFVQVTIISKTDSSVEARLMGRFATLSANGMIHIELPEPPQGTNCIDWGDLDGPVYIVARSALVRDGHASILGEPVKRDWSYARQLLQRQRRNARIYVDPDYAKSGQP